MAYLRVIVNPKDEESLKRIINYPSRGIGQTTLDKLLVGAKQHGVSIFELLQKANEFQLQVNGGTLTRLSNFVRLIEALQIENEKLNAFEIADLVTKKAGLVTELKKDGTPEGVARIENIEELLNGIRDFTEGQKELVDSKGDLIEFLEDVALATDFDKENESDIDRVALMTIHLAKGLEFPFVYIVGMEEDLFPSAMSMNTRAELEEERRLFYVALTRAKERAFLTYALSRYRWGKLIDAEPSRFIEEIEDRYIEIDIPKDTYAFKPLLDPSIFGDSNTTKTPAKLPPRGVKLNTQPSAGQYGKLRRINAQKSISAASSQEILSLTVGMRVAHSRFGNGTVQSLEGQGSDKKAMILFPKPHGEKNLLLRFAKLQILS